MRKNNIELPYDLSEGKYLEVKRKISNFLTNILLVFYLKVDIINILKMVIFYIFKEIYLNLIILMKI